MWEWSGRDGGEEFEEAMGGGEGERKEEKGQQQLWCKKEREEQMQRAPRQHRAGVDPERRVEPSKDFVADMLGIPEHPESYLLP